MAAVRRETEVAADAIHDESERSYERLAQEWRPRLRAASGYAEVDQISVDVHEKLRHVRDDAHRRIGELYDASKAKQMAILNQRFGAAILLVLLCAACIILWGALTQ
jgi:hypothetical protein